MFAPQSNWCWPSHITRKWSSSLRQKLCKWHSLLWLRNQLFTNISSLSLSLSLLAPIYVWLRIPGVAWDLRLRGIHYTRKLLYRQTRQPKQNSLRRLLVTNLRCLPVRYSILFKMYVWITVQIPSRHFHLRNLHTDLIYLFSRVETYIGTRAFFFATPTICNSLPVSVESAEIIITCHRYLKTYLSNSAFLYLAPWRIQPYVNNFNNVYWYYIFESA